MSKEPLHTFHIPVMGLAFTVDTPIKVARFGIDSVVAIIEDKLVEMMRRHYYQERNLTYVPITSKDFDYRARRITDYLNLMNNIIKEQIETLKKSTFEIGSDVVKYFEMLPDKSIMKLAYERMKASTNVAEKEALLTYLRGQIFPGRIDVNIMTKVDRNNYGKDGTILPDSSDALAALRGYANSELKNSSVIFSAGLNPRLFNYLDKFQTFQAKGPGEFEKEIVIKVSDFRSALIQGKYLAKKGIWVSEFRIESGLNCGGHAFATDGSLMGPILQEFKSRRDELVVALHTLYNAALTNKGMATYDHPHPLRLTVQGGIGTSEEDRFLRSEYGMDRTGWGTPFLLCPEATTVDDATLRLLCEADENKVVLSKNSPLGVRFNYLKNTSGEAEKLERIRQGKPGSPCTEKHLVSNTEFTKEPICTASYTYQKHKLAELKTLELSVNEYEKRYSEIVGKECLCVGLSNSAVKKYELPPIKSVHGVTICPGPNIVYFDKIVTLRGMSDHIYGRKNILNNGYRPHMFIKELKLNVDYLQEQASEKDVKAKDLLAFGNQLLTGISYYRSIAVKISAIEDFINQLSKLERRIMKMLSESADLVLQPT
jgi:hypothetical protein